MNDELARACLIDPLAFGITHIPLGDGKVWELSTRRWLPPLYHAINPYRLAHKGPGPRSLVVKKSTQSGITTLAMVLAFHFASHWPTRTFYTMPRDKDITDLVSTRIDPMIAASPFLSGKLGEPNNYSTKRIGDSFIYFMAMTTEPRSIPADLLLVDEVDLSDPNNIITAMNRLDASDWKLRVMLSTPTLAGVGIDKMFNASSAQEWMVKCPKCGYEQELNWDKNVKVKGNPNNPTEVYYGCARCDTPMSLAHIQTGRWVPKHPEQQGDIVGFHIHQMMTTDARTMWKLFRDPQTNIVEFYRKRLGTPYEVAGGSLDRNDLLSSLFTELYKEEEFSDGESMYFMGVDQANELQVLIAKVEPGNPNRKKIVHLERVPMDVGFPRLYQLMNQYRIRVAVVDADPNRHSSLKFSQEFPGRVLLADYTNLADWYKLRKLGKVKHYNGVKIDRTTNFDRLMDTIRKGDWGCYGKPPSLPQEVEVYLDQVSSLKRDTEMRKRGSVEVEVAVWRTLRQDHYAHSMGYCMIAIDSVIKRGAGRIGIVSAKPVEVEEGVPSEDIQKFIVSKLAQVPTDQLQDLANGVENYKFPLSHKMRLLGEANIERSEILWVLKNYFRIRPQKALTESK